MYFCWNQHRQNNWLLYCTFKPPKDNTSTHMYRLSKSLDICMNRYSNIFFLRDLILERQKTIWMIFVMFTISGTMLKNHLVSRILIIHHLWIYSYNYYSLQLSTVPSICSCSRSRYLCLCHNIYFKKVITSLKVFYRKKKQTTKNLLKKKNFFP